jgi:hypothetical protein
MIIQKPLRSPEGLFSSPGYSRDQGDHPCKSYKMYEYTIHPHAL